MFGWSVRINNQTCGKKQSCNRLFIQHSIYHHSIMWLPGTHVGHFYMYPKWIRDENWHGIQTKTVLDEWLLDQTGRRNTYFLMLKQGTSVKVKVYSSAWTVWKSVSQLQELWPLEPQHAAEHHGPRASATLRAGAWHTSARGVQDHSPGIG
jgi:hypothetical protein